MLYLNIEPEEGKKTPGKKTPLKAFNHILVEKGRYSSIPFWLIQISWEQRVTQIRLVNLHTDGVDILNTMLNLWCPQRTPKSTVRKRNTGYEVEMNRSMLAVLEPGEEEDDEKEPAMEA